MSLGGGFCLLLGGFESAVFHLSYGVMARGVVGWGILATCVAINERIKAYYTLLTTKRNNLHILAVARLEAYGGGSWYVEVAAEGQRAVELQVAIHLEEVEVRTHLNRSVARVSYPEGDHSAAGVVLNIILGEFDREAAFGMHLNIPATTAIRFEPGDEKEVELVEYSGKRRVIGFNSLVSGYTGREDEPTYYPRHAHALRTMHKAGFKDEKKRCKTDKSDCSSAQK